MGARSLGHRPAWLISMIPPTIIGSWSTSSLSSRTNTNAALTWRCSSTICHLVVNQMSNKIPTPSPGGEVVVYEVPDGKVRVDVRFDQENWSRRQPVQNLHWFDPIFIRKTTQGGGCLQRRLDLALLMRISGWHTDVRCATIFSGWEKQSGEF